MLNKLIQRVDLLAKAIAVELKGVKTKVQSLESSLGESGVSVVEEGRGLLTPSSYSLKSQQDGNNLYTPLYNNTKPKFKLRKTHSNLYEVNSSWGNFNPVISMPILPIEGVIPTRGLYKIRPENVTMYGLIFDENDGLLYATFPQIINHVGDGNPLELVISHPEVEEEYSFGVVENTG